MRRCSRLAWFLVTACAACTTSSSTEPTPRHDLLVFVEDGTGDLVAVDLPTGDRRALWSGEGTAQAIALSPDGREVAFDTSHALGGLGPWTHDLQIAATDGSEVRGFGPSTREYMVDLRWGATSDWLFYIGGSYPGRTYVLPRGATVARELPTSGGEQFPAGTGSGDARVAYAGETGLVVEAPDGSDRRVFDAPGVPIGFDSDGGIVLVLRDGRLRGLAIDGTGTTDLLTGETSVSSPWSVIARLRNGGSTLSPDGEEILLIGSTALVAARVDGSGFRTVGPPPQLAAFSARDDIVYVTSRLIGKTDTPLTVYSVFVESAGHTIELTRDEQCQATVISRAGTHLALDCVDRVRVHSLPDGALILDVPAAHAVGFNHDADGIVVADRVTMPPSYPLRHIPLDGDPARDLGVASMIAEGTYTTWPVFALAP